MDIVDMMREKVKKDVEAQGYPVHMGSAYCREFQVNHPNCKGCESEEGCKLITEIELSILGIITNKINLCEIRLHPIKPNKIAICAPIPPELKDILLKLLKKHPDFSKDNWILDQHKDPEKCEDPGRWHYLLVKEV